MKKLLLTAIVIATASAVFGQGQLIFQNGTSTAITNASTGQRAVVSTTVGLYVNANSTALPAAAGWTLMGTTNLTAPGIFFGGTRTLPGFPAGAAIGVQVRAWLTTGSFPDYATAVAGEPGGLFGWSNVFPVTPSAPPAGPPNLVASGLQPFTIGAVVPEPSSIALGLLGLGAIALFRRRK